MRRSWGRLLSGALQMLGKPNSLRASAVLAPLLCNDARPLLVQGQRGLSEHGHSQRCHQALPSSYSAAVRCQSKNLDSCTSHSTNTLIASASTNRNDKNLFVPLHASSPMDPPPTEPCASRAHLKMEVLQTTFPAERDCQLPHHSEANTSREDPQDTSSSPELDAMDESSLLSIQTEALELARAVPSSTSFLPSSVASEFRQDSENGTLPAELSLPHPSMVRPEEITPSVDPLATGADPAVSSTPRFYGHPVEMIPDEEYEELDRIMKQEEARYSSRQIVSMAASNPEEQETVLASSCTGPVTLLSGDVSMSSPAQELRAELMDAVSVARGRARRTRRGKKGGGSSMIVLALSATLSQASNQSLRSSGLQACSTAASSIGAPRVSDVEELGRPTSGLVPELSRFLRTSATGGGEGSLADEKSGVQSAWILPEGLRPLDLRQSGGLAVTDFTGSEWCELQMSFKLTQGKPAPTPAMQAGSERHKALEEEVVTVEVVEVETREDAWAVRLLDSIARMWQAMREGMTREVLVVSKVHGVWFVGIIDEMRLLPGKQPPGPEGMRPKAAMDVERGGGGHAGGTVRIVDTKTRRRPTAPLDGQKRNSRLQLMLYKKMLDEISETGISAEDFCAGFGLNPSRDLSPVVTEHGSAMFPDRTITSLADVLVAYSLVVKQMPRTDDELLLRYEWQKDKSLLGQDLFEYETEWVEDNLRHYLEYWNGKRPPNAVDERWKCSFCDFSSVCPAVPKDAGAG